MKRGWKIVRYLSLIMVFVSLLWWLLDGAEMFTKSKRLVEEVDPLFGTKVQKWVEDFTLGLLPSGTSGMEWIGALPLAGLFAVVGITAWWIERKRWNVTQNQGE